MVIFTSRLVYPQSFMSPGTRVASWMGLRAALGSSCLENINFLPLPVFELRSPHPSPYPKPQQTVVIVWWLEDVSVKVQIILHTIQTCALAVLFSDHDTDWVHTFSVIHVPYSNLIWRCFFPILHESSIKNVYNRTTILLHIMTFSAIIREVFDNKKEKKIQL